jgi:hypothetical protein
VGDASNRLAREYTAKAEAYDIIYERRFRRAIAERFGPEAVPPEISVEI